MTPLFNDKLFINFFGFKRTKTGGGEGDRTPDLMLAKHALSQLSYTPNFLQNYTSGGPNWDRTNDLRVISTAL